MQPRPRQEPVHGLFAQGPQRFQPVQPFQQNVPPLARAHPDRRLLTVLEDILGQRLHSCRIQRLGVLGGHIDFGNGEGLDFQHLRVQSCGVPPR